jgi:hypothetical protein
MIKEQGGGVVVRIRIAQIIIYFVSAVLLIWVIATVVEKCVG